MLIVARDPQRSTSEVPGQLEFERSREVPLSY
jgi:hypothetical protein